MPALLRRDAIRLFESSLEALQLAVASLGATKRIGFRQPSAEYAIEVGLLGVAAELAMAACLVQAFGPSVLLRRSGMCKTARTILDEFKRLVSDASINSEFLVQGVENPSLHRQTILDHTNTFRLLISMRAAALHTGRGLLHEAAVVQANAVADFLDILGRSERIRPYVSSIPRCQWYTHDRTLIIEDLNRRLYDSSGDERITNLASLYLVLPDIPEDEPDWLQAFERITLSPRSRDIAYLMTLIENALPVSLRRVTSSGAIVPVAIRQDDPEAIPIEPQYLRRQFKEIHELWHADIATANGRLEQGSLDLPPVEAVREVFALGLEQSRIIGENGSFSAHQSWVHILSSLAVQGTPGPYWFLVRRTPDLGQLIAQLNRARNISSNYIRQRIDGCIHGIEAIRERRELARDDRYFQSLIRAIEDTETVRDRLIPAYERNKEHSRGLPSVYREALRCIAEEGDTVGPLLNSLLSDEDVNTDCIRYWARKLAECAMDEDDLPALVTMLARDDLACTHTSARKAIRRIDFRLYGPPIAP